MCSRGHARSAWHTHPLGQNLIVTAGSGYFAAEAAEFCLVLRPTQVLVPGYDVNRIDNVSPVSGTSRRFCFRMGEYRDVYAV